MNTLMIREDYVNQTEGCRYGGTDWYEPYTDNKAKLFRSLQREFGRCSGKVYVDTPTGTQSIGWVFEKKVEYRTMRHMKSETYIQETWITYREAQS